MVYMIMVPAFLCQYFLYFMPDLLISISQPSLRGEQLDIIAIVVQFLDIHMEEYESSIIT